MNNYSHICETESTNKLLWERLRVEELPEGFVVSTDFQTAGKGQHDNSWESVPKENLLFSILLKPLHLSIEHNFILSQIVSVGIKRALDNIVSGVTIKWPNDIYWNDKKLGGILIENAIQGEYIKTSIVGIGINVNQKEFVSNAPNPISISQICDKDFDREMLLQTICSNIMFLYNDRKNYKTVSDYYFQSLYRKSGFHLYQDAEGLRFEAQIKNICPDGQLVLTLRNGVERSFYFKEVQFI